MEITIDFEIGLDYYSVTLEGSPEWVNNGIGAYEFWGSPGVHNDYCIETEEYEIVEVYYYTEEEEEDTVNDPGLNEFLIEYIDWHLADRVQEQFAENYDHD